MRPETALVLAGLLLAASAASAEPIALTDDQLDEVTAGGTDYTAIGDISGLEVVVDGNSIMVSGNCAGSCSISASASSGAIKGR